jgi:hypothetical protein
MSPAEIIDLLTFAAAYDQRTVGQGDVAAWHSALFKLDLDEAHEAVISHYRESTQRIMPADIYRRCRPPALRHLSAVPDPVPAIRQAPDPDRWRRMWEAALTEAAAAGESRRALVLGAKPPEGDGSPPLSARLLAEPLGYAYASQWNGFIPPEMFNGERNRSPRRDALLALVEDALALESAEGDDR